MKNKVLISIIVVVSILGALLVIKQKASASNGLTKVKRYNYIEPGDVACQAIMPECGECFGEVINKECFVDKQKLTESERQIMGVN